MIKIGFVTPWFGENIPGGAEAQLRGLVTHIHGNEIECEILTTCVREFASDWARNHYSEGIYDESGITVRRFKVDKRNKKEFDDVNFKLMSGIHVSSLDEKKYKNNVINSKRLYQYIEKEQSKYNLFVFMPYMFGTTFNGCQICPEKSIVIPCLHDESYAYMNVFNQSFKEIKGMVFLSKPEAELAHSLYQLNNVNCKVLGGGGFNPIEYHSNVFYKKYMPEGSPYILYMGRKDVGKNVDILLKYFAMYKKRYVNDLKLVLLGGGEIAIPESINSDVIDLGFLPSQDKYNAAAGSLFLCQPSANESFSLVIMESWLCGRPILVNGDCKVTTHFATESNGGLYYKSYLEFEGCTNYFLSHLDQAKIMGKNGKNYVMNNFTWDVIVNKYTKYFNEVCESEK